MGGLLPCPFRKDFLQALAIEGKLGSCVLSHLFRNFKPVHGHGYRILRGPAFSNIIDHTQHRSHPFANNAKGWGTRLPNQQSETAIAFLHAAVAFYAQHGISIRRLLTDNGSCYRSRQFRAACLQLGIQHRFTRPYTPRTNGKAERFIQTALREWAYVRHYLTSEERDQQLSPWLDHYNFHRPHGSLGYAPPISRASPVGTTS